MRSWPLCDLLMTRCSGKTVDEVWKAIHGAIPNGVLSAAVPGGPPPSYESLPLGTLLESLGVMSVEGLGFPLNSVPSYLPPVSQQAGLPPQQPLSIQPLADTQASAGMHRHAVALTVIPGWPRRLFARAGTDARARPDTFATHAIDFVISRGGHCGLQTLFITGVVSPVNACSRGRSDRRLHRSTVEGT